MGIAARARVWLLSTDHVRVGILWLAATFLFLLVGGFAAIAMRAELTFPGEGFLGPHEYPSYFTLHGTAMIFFFAVPVFFGLGSILVPPMIGARNMAFPRLNSLDLWLVVLGGLLLEAGFLLGHRPIAGWTSYTPLSLDEFTPGLGQDLWALGILLETVGGTLAGANFVVTILRTRRPDLPMRRANPFVWAMLFTSFLVLFAGPFLVAALAMMLLDRNVGTWFFAPWSAQGAILWQDLFWFYSHPATYVMVVPAFGVLALVIPRFAGRPLFSRAAVILAAAAVTILGFLVWWHHMLATGMDRIFRLFGASMSWTIAIPSGVLVLAWAFTLRGGRVRLATPMLFALGWLLMFTVGGANGLFMAYIPFDTYVHDTYWLVAHIHYVIFGGTVLGFFAAVYHWWPAAFRRRLDEGLGKLHFWGTFVGMNLAFFPMHFLGLEGVPRRVYDFDEPYAWTNLAITGGMFLVAAATAVFLGNVVLTALRGRSLDHDPWGEGA